MKKTILFFSLIIVGTFIMFGFRASENITNNENIVNTIDNQISTSGEINYQIPNSQRVISDKCGTGKCGAGKTKNASKAESKYGAGKCGAGKTQGKKHNFIDKDSNGDGKVSIAEFKSFANKEFPNKDTNGDGKITSDECPMFDKFNTDGNDFLSKDEFFYGHTIIFNKMDINKDGFVTKSESQENQKCGAVKCGGNKKELKKDSKCGAVKCGE
jgi:uncharacterized low-complexity protein